MSLLLGVMDSRGLVSGPIFASLGLGTHICESRSRSRRFQVSRLWILQRNSLLKFLPIQIFCLLYLQVRNNQNMSEKFQKLEKIQVRSTGVRRHFSREESSIFCLSSPCCWWYNANARSQNALPFLHHNENAPATQGRNERARGEQFPGHRITMGAP